MIGESASIYCKCSVEREIDFSELGVVVRLEFQVLLSDPVKTNL